MTLRKEMTIALSLLAFSIAVLPALIFVVGITVVGPYEGDAGLASLYGAIIGGAADLEIPAWALILGPYVVVQFLRLAFFRRA